MLLKDYQNIYESVYKFLEHNTVQNFMYIVGEVIEDVNKEKFDKMWELNKKRLKEDHQMDFAEYNKYLDMVRAEDGDGS